MTALERATKLLVLAWAVAAVAAQVWLLRGWRLATWAEVAFVAGLAVAAYDRRGVGAILVATYLFPAILAVRLGSYQAQFSVVMMAAIVGVMLPDAASGWHVPARWRAALVCWALLVVAGTSLVAWRELDFNLSLLFDGRLSNSSGGGFPASVVSWVLHVGLVLAVGILWFDWLCGPGRGVFARAVAGPLLASALLMALVAIYQMAVDITFLNRTVYGNIARAAATMQDANVAGVLAAMWAGGAMVWFGLERGWRRSASAVCAIVAWLAVWASGSRTAFAAAAIAALVPVVGMTGVRRLVSMRAVAGAAAVAAVFVALVVLGSRASVGPMRRLWETLPTTSVAAVSNELWRRDGYGTVATSMIVDSPWFGSGVGIFPRFLADIMPTLPGDNAQNWYRHQLVEFGLVGSLGWIAWMIGFGRFLLKRGVPPAAWILRGVILSVAAVSLVGMPGQDFSVTLTFWTFVFWYMTLAGVPDEAPSAMGWRAWTAVFAVVTVFVAGTMQLGLGRFRVPMRAQRVGWPYMYGFSFPEPDGNGGEFRWAGQRAVAVVDAPRRWLALTVRVNRGDLHDRPVDAKVWNDGHLLLSTRLNNEGPVTRYVRLRDDEQRVVIDTWVNRVARAPAGDSREFGLMVKWEFLDGLPRTTAPALVERP